MDIDSISGKVQYVDKLSLNSDELVLLAALDCGEELKFPRGKLCLKSCTFTPQRATEIFELNHNFSELRARMAIRINILLAFGGRENFTFNEPSDQPRSNEHNLEAR